MAQGEEEDQNVQSQSSSQKLLKARQLLIEGTDCLHSNQNQLAKSKLSSACAIAPDLPQAHHQLGIALAKLGENDEAANEFLQATKLDPNLAASWLNLAAVYQSTGKIDQAKNTYQEFINRFPQDKDVVKIKSLIAVLDKADMSTGNVQAVDSVSKVNDDYYNKIVKKGLWLWPKDKLPLTVYIDPPNATNGALPQYINILKDAFSDWAAASKGMISLDFVKEASKASVVCSWSKDLSKFKNSNEAANTRIYGYKTSLDKGEMDILTVSVQNNKPISDNPLRATCLHEVGHILGLTGHSTNPNDVMYISATLKDSWVDLSDRDKNTLIHLYSSNEQ